MIDVFKRKLRCHTFSNAKATTAIYLLFKDSDLLRHFATSAYTTGTYFRVLYDVARARAFALTPSLLTASCDFIMEGK